ncbi:MAG: hypothetical protein ACPGVB_13180, partial [Chitinophagales bacterium]
FFNTQGYKEVEGLPDMVLYLREEWYCFEDYLQSMTSKYRTRTKSYRKKAKKLVSRNFHFHPFIDKIFLKLLIFIKKNPMKVNENKLPIYKFSSFTEDMVTDAFGLKQQLEVEGYLSDWLKQSETITIEEDEQKRLNSLNEKLKLFVRGWNEQELREKFISQILDIVNFDLYQLKVASFAEREMKVKYNNSIIQGKVEWMVASGLHAPKHPFFFIHEYKKEKDASNDPVGQLLVTLCVAQLLNNQKPETTLFNPNPTSYSHVPLYGTYILGRFWFFVRLKDKRYYISKAYNSEEMEDLRFILKMLKAQKQMIIELVSNLS